MLTERDEMSDTDKLKRWLKAEIKKYRKLRGDLMMLTADVLERVLDKLEELE